MIMARTRKIILRSIIGVGVFALSLGGAYFLTPNKVQKANFAVPTNNTQPESNNRLDNFIKRLQDDTGINEEKSAEREYYGIVATFNNFNLSFKKDSNSALNNIGIDGQLNFLMRGLKDINFSLDADLDYNGIELPLDITYVDQTAYLGIKDLKMKFGSATLKELLVGESDTDETEGLIYKYFNSMDTGINFDVLGFIDDKLDNLIDGLYSTLDPTTMMSSFKMGELADDEVGTGIVMSDEEINNGYRFNFTIQINKEDESTNQITSSRIPLHINTDVDYRMTKIELGDSSEGFSIGNFTVGGSLIIETKKDTEEDHVVKAPVDGDSYVEIIKYSGWLQKLANFLDEDNQKFGFDFALDVNSLSDNGVTKTVEKDIGRLEGSINADFSEIIDISDYKYSESADALAPKSLRRANLEDEQEEGLFTKIKNKANLYINLDLIGQKGTKSVGDTYTSLVVAYEEGQGYISLGESDAPAMKATIDTSTMNWLIDELPGMIAAIGGEDNAQSASDLFSFVTDSEFTKAIKSGDYSVIAGLISNLSNDDSTISFGLDLSTLGLGSNAKVNLKLDSEAAANNNTNKPFDLSIQNIELGSVGLGVSLESGEYNKVTIADKESYDSLNFLPTVFDQVSTILQEKKTGFSVSGSLLDDNGLGITLSGDGQFDYGNKFGYGDLTIKQYKYHNDQVWYTHKIALDVDNTTSDFKANNAYFVYGDTTTNDNIKGRTTIQSVLDIVDVFSTFISDYKNDARFTKFLAPLTKLLGVSELGNIIGAKDYFKLASNDVVKSIKKTGNIVSLTVGGTIFKLDSDIKLDIVLSDDNKISQINVNNLVIAGKKLNLSLAPTAYNENRVSSINHNWSFLDLSTIALLLKFGINTTVSNYYHIYAPITLNALSIFNVDFNIHVYIVVNGEYVKIYGIVEDALLVNSLVGLFSKAIQDVPVLTDRVVSEFTFETYGDNDPNKEDGVGGYFHFKTRCYKKISGRLAQTRHYVTTSKNLLEGNNLLTYLLQDFLLIQDGIVSKIGDISLDNSSEEKPAGNFTNLFTDTGYQYDANNKKWNIGINLNEITGVDALKDLELTLYGSNNERLSGLDVNLNIQASIAKISISAKLTLDTGSANQTDWSSSIQNSFATINNVSVGDKLNNPNSYVSK